MTNGFQELIEGWDGAGVVVHFDAATEAWFFVALHDATLGPPTGGCRMKIYPRPAEGLLDAMRLSRGMTYKWAVAGLGFGGGKSVIALRAPLRGEERAALLRRFGRFLEGLHGAYWTGEDMGTTPDDMATIAEESRFVHGVVGRDSRTGTREAVDPGPYTAQGVLAGIQGALEHTEGSSDLSGTSVLIQGVGDVGAPLARLMKEAWA